MKKLLLLLLSVGSINAQMVIDSYRIAPPPLEAFQVWKFGTVEIPYGEGAPTTTLGTHFGWVHAYDADITRDYNVVNDGNISLTSTILNTENDPVFDITTSPFPVSAESTGVATLTVYPDQGGAWSQQDYQVFSFTNATNNGGLANFHIGIDFDYYISGDPATADVVNYNDTNTLTNWVGLNSGTRAAVTSGADDGTYSVRVTSSSTAASGATFGSNTAGSAPMKWTFRARANGGTGAHIVRIPNSYPWTTGVPMDVDIDGMAWADYVIYGTSAVPAAATNLIQVLPAGDGTNTGEWIEIDKIQGFMQRDRYGSGTGNAASIESPSVLTGVTAVNGATVTVDTGTSIHGSNSIKAVYGASNNAGAIFDNTLSILGKTYTYTFWAKADEARSGEASAYLPASDGWVSDVTTDITTTSWAKYTITGTTDTANPAIIFRACQTGCASGDTVWYDLVTLQRSDTDISN